MLFRSQHGRTVTLASLRGKVVLLTFLDDTCTTDCPLIAQEFRDAGQLLGADTRRCGLTALTAGAFTPSGTPLVAGRCSRPGTVGIFAAKNGTWQAAGPALPATLDHQHTTVLRLTRTSTGNVALLETGTGPDASLLAAWSAGNGGHWALSPPVRLHDARLTSASFGPGEIGRAHV